MLPLCPNHERAVVSAARENKLKYWAEQQSSSLSHSTPVTTEYSQHQSQLSSFNLLDRSCEDSVCPIGLTVSSNLNSCPSGQRLLSVLPSLASSSISLSPFVFNLPVYHSLSHTHTHTHTHKDTHSCTSLAQDKAGPVITHGRKQEYGCLTPQRSNGS